MSRGRPAATAARFGGRSIAALAGVAFAALGWAGPLHVQAATPSSFSETYGTWTVRCAIAEAVDGASTRQCAMEQLFVWQRQESRQTQRLLTITLTPSDAGMEMAAVAPFGLLFRNGLRLRADAQEGVTLEFETCLPDGCLARGVLSPNAVRSFQTGKTLHVEADPAGGGDPFRLEGSLTGFSAAHARLLKELEAR